MSNSNLSLEISRTITPQINRTVGSSFSFSIRISMKNNAFTQRSANSELALAEGPSCIFVGPIETAKKENLEALYRQARDAYYNGKPLIVDDMFDKVELKLRWYGSKSVIKYPRCSLRQHSTYADAEEDPSQVWLLASVWMLLLTFGSLVFVIPAFYTVVLAYQDAFNSSPTTNGSTTALESLAMANRILFVAVGSLVGYPIASASVGALHGLLMNDLVALKGPCPNCGEEVFAFVQADKRKQNFHRTDCHVCESSLEFRPKVEQSVARPTTQWVHGRIYLVKQKRTNQRRWM
ncbi:Pgr5-like a protein [Thalictrum thalictroides]|uniref:Pgr5-like a protein n=1 Tax=Thalictrum thalictroides TaxID=46969 RepID=A0A7J6VUA2_THATH|nr:Pgr5-like a protein [Thalictrum thalictroides]